MDGEFGGAPKPTLGKQVAHPTRFERVTFAFGGQRSIQLSYGCVSLHLADRPLRGNGHRGFLLNEIELEALRDASLSPMPAERQAQCPARRKLMLPELEFQMRSLELWGSRELIRRGHAAWIER